MKEVDIMIMCSDEDNALNHIEVQCRDCQKDVTLSDSTIQSIKFDHPEIDLVENPPILVCSECFFKSYYDSEKVQKVFQIQADDIAASLK